MLNCLENTNGTGLIRPSMINYAHIGRYKLLPTITLREKQIVGVWFSVDNV